MVASRFTAVIMSAAMLASCAAPFQKNMRLDTDDVYTQTGREKKNGHEEEDKTVTTASADRVTDTEPSNKTNTYTDYYDENYYSGYTTGMYSPYNYNSGCGNNYYNNNYGYNSYGYNNYGYN
ncbi:MAG: hypothetical protein ACOZCO_07890, partial [Bacteroidota bacterium]